MTDVATRTPEFVHMRMQHTAVVRGDGVPVGEMIPFLDNAFTVLRAAVDAAAIAPDGPQFSRYDSELVGDVRLEGGIPLLAELTTPMSGRSSSPGCGLPAASRASHTGRRITSRPAPTLIPIRCAPTSAQSSRKEPK
jgi:hypothetical protein